MSPTFVFDPDGGALRFPALTALGVAHVVTTRRVGVSAPPYDRGNLGLGVPDDRVAVLANRAQAVGRLGLTLDSLTMGQQTHGDSIVIVEPGDRGRGARGDGFPATDGLITATPGIALMVLLADCSALALAAPDVGVIGLAHVGWRGTVARLAEKLAQTMMITFGADPAQLIGALAPGIGPCCYTVGDDVIRAVQANFANPTPLLRASDTDVRFDIPAALLQQLGDAGVGADRVLHTGLCTACRTDLFFSHRAERGRAGRFGMIAALAA